MFTEIQPRAEQDAHNPLEVTVLNGEYYNGHLEKPDNFTNSVAIGCVRLNPDDTSSAN